jgi:hypothetical protein
MMMMMMREDEISEVVKARWKNVLMFLSSEIIRRGEEGWS